MKLLQIILIVFSISLSLCNNATKTNEVSKKSIFNTEKYKTHEKPKINFKSTQNKAKQAFNYCNNKNFNTDFCILIDMSLHSGVKRFVVWDFEKDSIKYCFLVGHGCCENSWNEDFSKDNPQFSNTDGSHCSSLGKFRIGERGYSNWGVNIKYALHGLETTNSNAFKRLIVFHSWEVVTDEDVYPNGTPEGWGCPTISDNSFKIIDRMLKLTSKPVLMWIYK